MLAGRITKELIDSSISHLALLGLQQDEVKSRVKRNETIESKGLDADFDRLDSNFYDKVYALQAHPEEPENLWYICRDIIARNPERNIRAFPPTELE